MREVVRNVARLFPTAIISGRGREKVENFVQLRELYYAGSHGMDIAGPTVSAMISLGRELQQRAAMRTAAEGRVALTARANRVARCRWVMERRAVHHHKRT